MRLTIDGRETQVEAGTTILEAARALGIEIPTLCHMEGIAAQASCFLCVVRIEGREDFMPACSTPAAEGMVISTHTPEVVETRRTALELLLSDHAGACVASCSMACPADLDIPGFTRPLARGDQREAIVVIKRSLPLPATLGRICPSYCESACMRKRMDEALSVRSLHRVAAEADLASDNPYLPEKKPATGKRVAIVGAGPAGLSAAWFLLQEGHACVLFDAADRPGGLLKKFDASELDQGVLDAEIAQIGRLGAEFKLSWKLGVDGSLEDLRREFDAVLLALGASVGGASEKRTVDLEFVKSLGLEAGKKGIATSRESLMTSVKGVFAAGESVAGAGQMVWAVAAGRRAATSIHQYLNGAEVRGPEKPYYFRRVQQTEAELDLLYGRIPKESCALEPIRETPLGVPVSAGPPPKGGTPEPSSVPREAARCLQCGCASAPDCKLRFYAAQYSAQWGRFKGERRTLATDTSHREIIYEPGKCILCGLCLKIAEAAGEKEGLCFIGRGFTTNVAVPLGGDLAHGLQKAARACAQACPSGALSLKK